MGWFGGKVFQGMEWVGEGVVSVLGLDDSRFQGNRLFTIPILSPPFEPINVFLSSADVLDGMTEEEMAAAVAVQEQRQEEYRQMGFTVAKVGEETEEDLLRENDEAFKNLSYGMIAGSAVDQVRSTQIAFVEDVEVAVVTTEPSAGSVNVSYGHIEKKQPPTKQNESSPDQTDSQEQEQQKEQLETNLQENLEMPQDDVHASTVDTAASEDLAHGV